MVSVKKSAEMARKGHNAPAENTADSEKPQTSAEAARNTVSETGGNSRNSPKPELGTETGPRPCLDGHGQKPPKISTADVKRAMEGVRIGEGYRSREGSTEQAQKLTITSINNQSIGDGDDDPDDLLHKSQRRLYDGIIRVGRDYQAVLPALASPHDELMKRENIKDRDLLMWKPPLSMAESEIEEYLRIARDEHGYNDEQACGLLFWHKHNLRLSLLDLPKFTPSPEEFTPEDKILFEQALRTHGKHFRHIRQILPHKSIASLVKYFYTRKMPKDQTESRAHLRRNKAKREGDATTSTTTGAVGSVQSSDHCSDNSSSHEDIYSRASSSASSSSSSPPPLTLSAASLLLGGSMKACSATNKKTSI